MRTIFASAEAAYHASKSANKKVVIYSQFPVDRASCDCQVFISRFKRKLALENDKGRRKLLQETPYLICPRNKTGMHRYKIVCRRCKEIQGYCWATDKTLTDWCDFHYAQWSDGEAWYGCLTPHISPITEQLCLECCCGQDTRDFRANMTMNAKRVFRIEKSTSVGREFNTPRSKFMVVAVSSNVLS